MSKTENDNRVGSSEFVRPPCNAKQIIAEKLKLSFCDRDCGCGENNQLWWYEVGRTDLDKIPDWMNGVTTEEVWEWLIETGQVA